jgi:hypothetical protein
MNTTLASEPQCNLDSTSRRRGRRRLILIGLGACALILAQYLVYVPVLDYTSPFSTTGLVLGCGATPTIVFSSEPQFPPFARVTVFWNVNGSASLPLTFYVEQLTVSQSGQGTSWSWAPVAAWNGSSGSGSFGSDGGMYFFEGWDHPKNPQPFEQCPNYFLDVVGFYLG